MLIGKVMPSAIGRYKLGFALGTADFIAAGTAMYDAPAPSIANNNLLPTESVINDDTNRAIIP